MRADGFLRCTKKDKFVVRVRNMSPLAVLPDPEFWTDWFFGPKRQQSNRPQITVNPKRLHFRPPQKPYFWYFVQAVKGFSSLLIWLSKVFYLFSFLITIAHLALFVYLHSVLSILLTGFTIRYANSLKMLTTWSVWFFMNRPISPSEMCSKSLDATNLVFQFVPKSSK